ncbi:hypothetical protein AYK20_04345 [Thermoplasmatales archaeon SG8-52-1]|nr:MAG: hypothetical protein AYK20_04345 [Thermoplasmatales archaeon SG8-52-1]
MPNKLGKKGLVVGIIVLFIGAGAVSSTERLNLTISKTIGNDGSLLGYVNGTSGNPIEGALVRVYFHETNEEDYSDENGFYHITNIPICYCMKNVTCSKEGYNSEWELLSIAENTTYDFLLNSLEPYLVFNGSQCNGYWNSPINVSFVFDPEKVADIWYKYKNGWHPYIKPFVIDDEGGALMEWYWIDNEGYQSPHHTITFEIDYTQPILDIQWDVYKEKGNWYVKFVISAQDWLSGMDSYLDFYINDMLQDTYEVSWPSFEFKIQWTKILKNVTFGFGCSDNACNYALGKVNGSDIKSVDCLECQSNGKTHLAEKLLNKLERNQCDGITYINLTVYEAWELLNDTSNGIQIPIDIRHDEQWNEGFIDTPYPENAVHFSIDLLKNESGVQEFLEKYTDKEIVLYGKSNGYTLMIYLYILLCYNYTGTIYRWGGGLNEWINAGLPVRNNTAPDTPTIYGPTKGIIGKNYTFSFSAEDPDNDNVSFYIEWEDGTSTGWTDYFMSGEIVLISHKWNKIDDYNIRCKAKDIYGVEGNWTDVLIHISKDKAITSSFLLSFLERFHLLHRLLDILR